MDQGTSGVVDLVDTDVLIDLLKGRHEAVAWLNTLPDWLAVSNLARMEVIAGCRNAKEQREAEALLNKFATVYMTVADQERALLHFSGTHLERFAG